MAFPTIVSAATSEDVTNVTTHTVTLPASLVAGNRLLIFVSCDSNPTLTAPTGFTKIGVAGTEGSTSGTVTLFEKRNITGAEGASITFASSVAEASVHRAYQISGDDATKAAEITRTSTTSATPDPASLTPTWGALDTLWLIGVSTTDDADTISAYPTNYVNSGIESNLIGGQGAILGWCTRTNNTATEDPSAFTMGVSTSTRIILAGIPPLVATAVVITNVDIDNSITGTQTNVVITGTGFRSTQGSGHVRVYDGALYVTPSIDSWADTSIQFDMSIGTSTGIRYGQRTLRVTHHDGTIGEKAITVTAPSGISYVDLTSIGTTGEVLTADVLLEAGDQIEWDETTGKVYADATLNAVVPLADFDWRVHDVTTGWGTSATATIDGILPVVTTTTLPAATVNGIYEQTLAAIGDTPITWAVSAGSLNTGLTLDTATGVISGVATGAGIGTFTVEATNSEGVDTQALTITAIAYSTVPNVIGLAVSDAQLLIFGVNLTYETTDAFSEVYEIGTVSAQTPAAGEVIVSGSLVSLSVSLGTEAGTDPGDEDDVIPPNPIVRTTFTLKRPSFRFIRIS